METKRKRLALCAHLEETRWPFTLLKDFILHLNSEKWTKNLKSTFKNLLKKDSSQVPEYLAACRHSSKRHLCFDLHFIVLTLICSNMLLQIRLLEVVVLKQILENAPRKFPSLAIRPWSARGSETAANCKNHSFKNGSASSLTDTLLSEQIFPALTDRQDNVAMEMGEKNRMRHRSGVSVHLALGYFSPRSLIGEWRENSLRGKLNYDSMTEHRIRAGQQKKATSCPTINSLLTKHGCNKSKSKNVHRGLDYLFYYKINRIRGQL